LSTAVARAAERIAAQAARRVILIAVLIGCSAPAAAQTIDELREMSIDDLAEVNVSSVSKSDEPIGAAPASIYLIGNEAIARSGATTLPEILRLAPNLSTYQRAPGSWVVTARGMNGNLAAQSYSNKLLVLVDGRTVYSPLFSGVYWDLPDVLPEDIDRIEVISGPGATLWGANAMNGVINIITKSAVQSAGAFASAQAGESQRTVGARFGGSIGDNLDYRVFARWIDEEAAWSAPGVRAQDGWRRLGGGFRVDWTPNDRDAVMLQGEAFSGTLGRGGPAEEDTEGRSVTLRWNHRPSTTSELQVQGFYDRVERDSRASGGGKFTADSYDLEFQHSFAAGRRHTVVWGSGVRRTSYRIDGTATFFFDPPIRDLFLAQAFVQDSFAITPKLSFTAGLKVEKDPYVKASLLPEARIAWRANATTLLWASASRAVRSPTPFDRDVEERAGFLSLSGDRQFRTEKLTAFELGLRMQPAPTLSFSLTGYYHQYEDLRSIELLPGPGLNLTWGNMLKGHSYGIEAWGDLRLTSWWKISAGLHLHEQKLSFAPGASGLLDQYQLGNDPSYRIKLHTSLNLAHNLTLDADFRAVGALPGTSVRAYREVGGRLAWTPVRGLTLTVSGANLLHEYHREYEGGDLIPRKVMAGVELRY
jgi:iron complex outermembrane receptor protein